MSMNMKSILTIQNMAHLTSDSVSNFRLTLISQIENQHSFDWKKNH